MLYLSRGSCSMQAQWQRWAPLFTVAWKPVWDGGWRIHLYICVIGTKHKQECILSKCFNLHMNTDNLFRPTQISIQTADWIPSFSGYIYWLSGKISLLRIITAPGQTVSQDGKKSSGEIRWLCSVGQTCSLLPVPTPNPSCFTSKI